MTKEMRRILCFMFGHKWMALYQTTGVFVKRIVEEKIEFCRRCRRWKSAEQAAKMETYGEKK